MADCQCTITPHTRYRTWMDILPTRDTTVTLLTQGVLLLRASTILDAVLQQHTKGLRDLESRINQVASAIDFQMDVHDARQARNRIAHHICIPSWNVVVSAVSAFAELDFKLHSQPEHMVRGWRTSIDRLQRRERVEAPGGKTFPFNSARDFAYTASRASEEERGLGLLFAAGYLELALQACSICLRIESGKLSGCHTEYRRLFATFRDQALAFKRLKFRQRLSVAFDLGWLSREYDTEGLRAAIKARNVYAHRSVAPNENDAPNHIHELFRMAEKLRQRATLLGVDRELLKPRGLRHAKPRRREIPIKPRVPQRYCPPLAKRKSTKQRDSTKPKTARWTTAASGTGIEMSSTAPNALVGNAISDEAIDAIFRLQSEPRSSEFTRKPGVNQKRFQKTNVNAGGFASGVILEAAAGRERYVGASPLAQQRSVGDRVNTSQNEGYHRPLPPHSSSIATAASETLFERQSISRSNIYADYDDFEVDVLLRWVFVTWLAVLLIGGIVGFVGGVISKFAYGKLFAADFLFWGGCSSILVFLVALGIFAVGRPGLKAKIAHWAAHQPATRFVGRIVRLIIALGIGVGAVGGIVGLAAKGWTAASGFVLYTHHGVLAGLAISVVGVIVRQFHNRRATGEPVVLATALWLVPLIVMGVMVVLHAVPYIDVDSPTEPLQAIEVTKEQVAALILSEQAKHAEQVPSAHGHKPQARHGRNNRSESSASPATGDKPAEQPNNSAHASDAGAAATAGDSSG